MVLYSNAVYIYFLNSGFKDSRLAAIFFDMSVPNIAVSTKAPLLFLTGKLYKGISFYRNVYLLTWNICFLISLNVVFGLNYWVSYFQNESKLLGLIVYLLIFFYTGKSMLMISSLQEVTLSFFYFGSKIGCW